jgi:hypothetical protein
MTPTTIELQEHNLAELWAKVHWQPMISHPLRLPSFSIDLM